MAEIAEHLKSSFSIHDLEILSGIKAHTIRIWEKRYEFLNPARKGRNVRIYSVDDLRKLLNATLLYKNNYKISEITALSNRDLRDTAKEVGMNDVNNSLDINTIIISMFTLDESLFESVYVRQIKNYSFEEIYLKTYVPVLRRIGMLWQTNSIKPAHEHFLSAIVVQKIVLEIAKIKPVSNTDKAVHILFLPEGEIHEIGLMFLNYYLRARGFKVVSLGSSIPANDLFEIKTQFNNIHWVTSFVMTQPKHRVQDFLDKIDKLLEGTNDEVSILGYLAHEPENYKFGDSVKLSANLEEFMNK